MLIKRGSYAIENSEMLSVALPHVFNLITVSFIVAYLKAELICHIWGWHLIKGGIFQVNMLITRKYLGNCPATLLVSLFKLLKAPL